MGWTDTIRAAKAGDRQAFELLFGYYRRELCGYANRWLHGRIRRRIDASDVVQDVLAVAYRRFQETFQGKTASSARAWFYTILRRKLCGIYIDHQRDKRSVEKEQSWDAAGVVESVLADHDHQSSRCRLEERFARLQQALGTLPEFQRRALELKYLDGLSNEDIALKLDRSLGAVGGYLKRGMKAVRAQLRDAGKTD